MPLWLILGAVGVGGYLLLSKSAAASSSNVASAQAASNAAMAQAIAANPSGLQPGFQGQVSPQVGPVAPNWGFPTTTQQGGQVFDPNLGGVPTLDSIQQGLQYGAASTTTASGMVDHHWKK